MKVFYIFLSSFVLLCCDNSTLKEIDDTDTCWIEQNNDGYYHLYGKSHLVKNVIFLAKDNNIEPLVQKSKDLDCRLIQYKWFHKE